MNEKNILKEILDILKALKNAGFEAYLVGGCVRDLLLEREPKDWDITTNANPEEIQKVFPDSFYENNFGTVGVKTATKGESRLGQESKDRRLKVVEITPYRLESKYSDNRHPDEIKFSKNLEDDLKRRDFTVNSMAMTEDGELTDLFDGQKDLKNKIIRTVGKPNERFGEDALRIMRAVRFSTELSFSIETETQKAILSSGNSLKNISKERIKDEFSKILLSDNPMIGLVMLQKMALLSHIAPPLEKMVGVEQNKEAHKYDVWEHSLRALQHAADKGYDLDLRIAALFHDVSKPETKRVEKGGKTTFFGHEVVGARVANKTLKELRFSKEIIEKVTKLVRWHMFFSDPDEITLSAVRRMIVRVGEENIWDLMNIRKCDRIGTGRPKEQPFRFRKYQSMIDEALRDPISVGMLKVDGEVLIKELGIKPGPMIGNILHALFDEVLDDPKKNTKEYLINKSKELKELGPKELKELGDKGKQRMGDEDEKEVKALRDKHHVS